jgi:hypothetical protein
MSKAPLPVLDDRETAPFFAAAAESRLVFRGCVACGRGIHPPSAHCPYCGGWDTRWREAAGTGKVHTWTVVTHPIHPGFETPYTLVVVELGDAADVRLVGRLEGRVALAPGQPMRVWFEPMEGGGALPQWRVAEP